MICLKSYDGEARHCGLGAWVAYDDNLDGRSEYIDACRSLIVPYLLALFSFLRHLFGIGG